MGRQPRIQYPGAIYHVFARGIDRQPVFTQREDYERFLESLEMAISFAQFQVWCYALMDNHYHLLIMTPNGNLTQAMHALQNRYVKSFNAAHDRIGPLFQGRYKSLLVADERFLMELSRYIHLNPYRKGLVKKPERYEWCSYGAYIGLVEPPGWLMTDAVLGRFGDTRQEALLRHLEFVEAGRDLPEWNPYEIAVEGVILGTKKLLRQLLKSSDPEKTRLSEGIQRSKLYTPDEILEIISGISGDSPDAIRAKQRPSSAARVAAIYLSRCHTTMSLSGLGKHFGGASSSAIANTCGNCEKKLKEYSWPELEALLTAAKIKLE